MGWLIALVRLGRYTSPEGGGVDPRYFRCIGVSDLSWKNEARPVVLFGHYLPSKIPKEFVLFIIFQISLNTRCFLC